MPKVRWKRPIGSANVLECSAIAAATGVGQLQQQRAARAEKDHGLAVDPPGDGVGAEHAGNRSRRMSADLIEDSSRSLPDTNCDNFRLRANTGDRKACGNSMKKGRRPYSAAIGISSTCSCSTTPASGSNSPIHGLRASTAFVWA